MTLGGNAKRSVAPRAPLFSAQSRPPCAAMIRAAHRQPSPMPSRLVVTNGWKMRSRSSGGMPGPLSMNETSTQPWLVSSRPDGQVTVLAPEHGVTAFNSRLMRTCCSWT
jgi:hypothetical protein